ncbi:MAG: serine--tRNA ligase [Marinilabiliales bacterium]|nr:MAG: serine--tRNA ligase [Marinilabiliales bacterium]
MLTLALLREKTEDVKKGLAVKNFNQPELVDEIIKLDDDRKALQRDRDEAQMQMNKASKEIGAAFKSGDKAKAEELKAETAKLKEDIKALSEKHDAALEAMNKKLILLPNMPHSSVKPGKSEEDNENIHQEGEIPEFSFKALPHWEITERHDIIDFELGNKITGAGFPVYKGKGAKLQRALISFFLDRATEAGYLEIQPPLVINEDSGYGTGQLPDKDGQMYAIPEDKLFLIPTAEVPVTNIYRNVMLKEDELPKKNTAYSACFRREAGSYGKDVRGLNRLHQFDKVEIVQIVHPEKSYEVLEEMREHVAGLLRELKLPFRILRLCGGDTSFTAALTYDFEVFSAAQKRWLEVSSVSNFESFQANRMKLRFKDKEGNTSLLHTLNGSALALPRILASLLENYQTESGVIIPEVLIPYTRFDEI